jgi:hypothetical protein
MGEAMHLPKWALFYDFHTLPAVPDVGREFDADRFTDRVKACGVDYLVFAARCNLGMAYYDTKVGTRHPSLGYDLFGKLADACRRKGIALTAYVNVGLSHEEALLHRDWATLWPDGHTYRPNRLDHFFRTMCYNTPYGDHVLEMVREIVSTYPVAGLFLDCMYLAPCVGVECVREMKQLGMDWQDGQRLREFAHLSRLRMAARISEAARAIKPNLLLHFNGVPYEDQQDIGTYLEYECLPTGGWGYESLPVYARYLRTLGKPVVNMTGRFHKCWGDFGGIRTEASLEYDCLYGLANGMPPTIGGHLHPRGEINHAVFDLIESIYKRLQRLGPWIEGAQPLAEAALVMPEPAARDVDAEAAQSAQESVRGATRLLCELKVQFDVVSYRRSWEGYRLLVLPDELTLDAEAAAKVRAHLDAGGAILSTGWSGLDPERGQFVFDDWGVAYQGPDACNESYYAVGRQLGDAIPAMAHSFYCLGTLLEPRPDTQVLAHVVAPYFDRHWDGEHGFAYTPPNRETARPAVTLNGAVAHVSHPIFRAYHLSAPVPLRQVVANLLPMLIPDPLVRAQGLPSFARMTLTSQPTRRMVHVLSYVPERRGPSIDMIEEPIHLSGVEVALRTDGRPPARVYMAPSQEPLAFETAGGYVRTTVPAVPGHALVVFEEEARRRPVAKERPQPGGTHE